MLNARSSFGVFAISTLLSTTSCISLVRTQPVDSEEEGSTTLLSLSSKPANQTYSEYSAARLEGNWYSGCLTFKDEAITQLRESGLPIPAGTHARIWLSHQTGLSARVHGVDYYKNLEDCSAPTGTRPYPLFSLVRNSDLKKETFDPITGAWRFQETPIKGGSVWLSTELFTLAGSNTIRYCGVTHTRQSVPSSFSVAEDTVCDPVNEFGTELKLTLIAARDGKLYFGKEPPSVGEYPKELELGFPFTR